MPFWLPSTDHFLCQQGLHVRTCALWDTGVLPQGSCSRSHMNLLVSRSDFLIYSYFQDSYIGKSHWSDEAIN